MTANDFVEALRTEAYGAAVSGCRSLLENPPGRRPAPELLKVSEWYRQLKDSDREAALKVAALAARLAVFGVLAVIDGVRAIEDSPDKGTLELRFVQGNVSELLNDPDSDYLHDLFNAGFA